MFKVTVILSIYQNVSVNCLQLHGSVRWLEYRLPTKSYLNYPINATTIVENTEY